MDDGSKKLLDGGCLNFVWKMRMINETRARVIRKYLIETFASINIFQWHDYYYSQLIYNLIYKNLLNQMSYDRWQYLCA